MSSNLSTYYSKPRFREGVEAIVDEQRASFAYYGTRFDVEFEQALNSDISSLVDALTNGCDVTSESISTVGRPHIDQLLSVLDRYGYITDDQPRLIGDILTGTELWSELADLSNKARRQLSFPYCEALASKEASRESLILYALQYYHVVLNGPRIIAAALSKSANPETQIILQDFLVEEMGHDKLLEEALVASGVSVETVRKSLPLPETFGLISYLQVLAEQEPLSFAGVVFLMEEENHEFHLNFVQACEQAGLGEAFWGPIKSHAHINDNGDHGNISAELLRHFPVVSQEEAVVVKKHLIGVLECLSQVDIALAHANSTCHSLG